MTRKKIKEKSGDCACSTGGSSKAVIKIKKK